VTGQRIVSLLPSATEIAFALGVGDRLVGVSHECDHPPEAARLPALVRSVLPLARMTPAEIDAAVTARLREGRSLYEIDEELLARLAPDLVLTQDLCQVCAPSGSELAQALSRLPREPDVICMTPRDLAGVRANVEDLARATGTEAAAARLLQDWRARMERVAAQGAALARRPRVFFMEWLDPIYCAGHWVPEMIRLAGGDDGLGREGAESVRVDWEEVVAFAPEVLILAPCGFSLEPAVAQAHLVASRPHVRDLPAVRDNRVYAVDANSYFARPGPRLVDGAELLSHLLAGGPWTGPAEAYRRVDLRR
jgi:iron complex transport system substrate-binding protein